ncbi:hypothetical protein [Companilactobacillus mishanensis]|uniref:Lipoprotein n=1 Tax=Companilactobacillus mishanensis TaxID=2486008 RepID=A0ABW9P9J4_9LACO|nr:hypothetical protein [Companilactobacillus mishanensis]MQS45841.1 hypothetical protein [Companilactobacillus mishanensis]
MKKLLGLILLLAIFPLTGCGNLNRQTEAESVHEANSGVDLNEVHKKKALWEKKLHSAKIQTIGPNQMEDIAFLPTSLDELKTHNNIVANGTIVDLEKMTGNHDSAFTKISMHVEKILYGKKTFYNKTIVFFLNSGFIDNPSQKDYNYIASSEVPIPKIGSKIIAGFNPLNIDPKNFDGPDEFFYKNGVGGKNAFIVNIPIYNLWVQNEGESKYKPNNPTLLKDTKDNWYSKKILSLTKDLNKLMNK